MAFMVDFIGIYGGFIGIQCGFIGIQCGFYWGSIEIEWNIIHKLTYFVHVLSGNVMVKYDMSYTVWNAIPIFRHPPMLANVRGNPRFCKFPIVFCHLVR